MPRLHGSLWLILLLLTALLAGCLGDEERGGAGPGDDDTLVDGIDLTDLTTCDFTYPDNATPVVCDSPYEVRTPTGTAPPSLMEGWLCINDNSGPQSPGAPPHGTWIFWHPDTDMVALYYYLDTTGPVQGLFRADDGDTVAWEGNEPTGFIPLFTHPVPSGPDAPLRELWFYSIAYTIGYTTDAPDLQGGTAEIEWSTYEDGFYPLAKITTGNETYYFNHTWKRTAHYGVDPEPFQGDDFELSFQFQIIQERTTAASLVPGLDCLLHEV